MSDANAASAGHVNDDAHTAGVDCGRSATGAAPEVVAVPTRARALRHVALVFLFGLGLGACEGSNAFEPCDPDGDTPYTPCEATLQ